MSIAVTAATSQLGRLAVADLVRRGTPAAELVAVGRSPERLRELFADQGVATRVADYTDPAALTSALAGAQTVVLISSGDTQGRVAQHRHVVEAAAAAGAGRIVYTSAPRATATDLVLAPDHAATERLLAESGLPTVVLRNNWYTENYLPVLETAAQHGVLLTSAGSGRVASASRADYAEAVAVAAADPGLDGSVLELGGDHAWDFAELAEAIGTVLGRPVRLDPVDAEEHLRRLAAAGVDEATAGFLVRMDADIAGGALDGVSGELSRLIGRRTTPLVDGLRAARG